MAKRKARKVRRKSKAKSKRKTTKTKRRSDIDVLKEQSDQLYPRVKANLDVILKQTGLETEELGRIIQEYGYEAIPTLDGFGIAEPIWDQMVKTFKLYDKVQGLVERLSAAHNKLFIEQLERKTIEMEAQVKDLEDEETFYTEKQRDKEGMLKMKQKYYSEKEHWDIKKAEAKQHLEKEPENEGYLADLAQAELQLKLLSKKRWKVRMQNVQPGIAKYSQKFGKVINTVQDSVQEITKPFAEMGKMGGMNQGGQEHNYAADWSPEKIFGSGKKKDKKEQSWDSGF